MWSRKACECEAPTTNVTCGKEAVVIKGFACFRANARSCFDSGAEANKPATTHWAPCSRDLVDKLCIRNFAISIFIVAVDKGLKFVLRGAEAMGCQRR